MAISADTVKELRDATGISVMQCKQALEEAGGDREKALLILRKKGSALAAKKSDRTFGAGTIAAYVHATKEVAALVVLSSETDFVSKNAEFERLAYDIAMHVAALNPLYKTRDDVPAQNVKDIEELLTKEVLDKPDHLRPQILAGKVDAYLKNLVLTEQPFIKDPNHTVGELIEAAVQKFGERIAVASFTRISVK